MITLRPYQEEAIRCIKADWDKGLRRVGVQLATGAGKTVLFSVLAQEEIDRGGRVLVLAHRGELLDQAIAKFKMVNPTTAAKIGLVKASTNEVDSDLVVASIQTACRPARLAQLVRRNFTLVVVDEAHHVAAETYQRVLEATGCLDELDANGNVIPDPDGPKSLYVSATLIREDNKNLGETIQNVAYNCTILDLIKGKYLKNIKGYQVKLEKLDLDAVHTVAGDFDQTELDEAMVKANAAEHVVDSWEEYAKGMKTIVFASSVKSAYAIAEEYESRGYVATAADYTVNDEDRKNKLKSFEFGNTTILSNMSLFTEGLDVPNVECIVMARPTKSTTLYVQSVGRGLRNFPGMDTCIFLDTVGSTHRHKLVNAAKLFNVKPDELANHGLIVANALQITRAIKEEERASGVRIVTPVDMFPSPEAFRWLTGTDGTYVLSCAGGVVEVYKGDSVSEEGTTLWSARLKLYDGITELAAGVDLGYAQGSAEDYVRSQGSVVLSSSDAKWRKQPATPQQLQLLRQLGVTEFPDSPTKGWAADKITVAKAPNIGKVPDWMKAPATPNQLAKLSRMGFNAPDGYTKGEASKKINEMVEENPAEQYRMTTYNFRRR